MIERRRRLKGILDRVLADCNLKERTWNDPIRFPLSYGRPEDREATAFIASALAYGRVSLFSRALGQVFEIMGPAPAEFARGFDPMRDTGRFDGIKYRFSEGRDIAALVYLAGGALREFGSIEGAFLAHYSPSAPDIGPALSGMMAWMLDKDTSHIYGTGEKPQGLRHLMSSPARGGASKRLCMFLRWMVRRKAPDLGLWKGLSPARLVIPLDTHIARISRCLGLTSRKANDWRTALEITRALSDLDPEDPLGYDFALCHLGISGRCSSQLCGQCPLGTGFTPRESKL